MNSSTILLVLILASAFCSEVRSESVVWTSCPEDSLNRLAHLRSVAGVTFQCTSIKVPFNWLSQPFLSPTISYFILRAYNSSLSQPPSDQLWMIQGGPGASGAGLEDAGLNVAALMGRQVTVYVPDNRGTGLSSCLGCNITECQWQPDLLKISYKLCAKKLFDQYGINSTLYTTTNAALDLDYAISLIKESEQVSKVYVYGVSYGTYIVNRFGLLGLNKPDAVILDSVCPADICRIDMFDKNWDFVARSVFLLCGAESETCIQNLGPNPNEMAQLVQTHFEQNLPFCKGAVNVTYEQFYQATLAFVPAAYNRELLPPLINRLLRCSPTDITEINYAFKSSSVLYEKRDRQVTVSLPVMLTVTLSEIFDSDPAHPLTLEEHQGIERTLLFSPRIAYAVAVARPYWLTYKPDSLSRNEYYTEDIPTLILQGELDPQTPPIYGIHAKTNYNQPHQQLVTIPYAPHETVRNDKASCGAQVMASFLNNPTGDVDTSCTSRVTPIDFEGVTAATKQASKSFFGTPLLWGTA
eukprot:TRINITY_DN6587_c0_g1_i1.p1 TRINITY_DN6587_c0_g1~~TRINITY_DN6587_c0_g1_i1.p1  ORF type:complete len:525 (+),score=73.78 TRINITY_DN6587_c0_g1_i1:3-1577(+)